MKSKEEAPKAENIRIVELVKDCKFVKTDEVYHENGHDCWGKLEYYTTTKKYIVINGKEETVFGEDWYVIHDGETVKEIKVLKPKVEYQENAIDFNYGWTRSTEKDYNNPKAGFEYRMILPSPVLEPKDSTRFDPSIPMRLPKVDKREKLAKKLQERQANLNKEGSLIIVRANEALTKDSKTVSEEGGEESQEDLDENILDVILIAKVNSKEEAKALISRQFTITRKQHGTD